MFFGKGSAGYNQSKRTDRTNALYSQVHSRGRRKEMLIWPKNWVKTSFFFLIKSMADVRNRGLQHLPTCRDLALGTKPEVLCPQEIIRSLHKQVLTGNTSSYVGAPPCTSPTYLQTNSECPLHKGQHWWGRCHRVMPWVGLVSVQPEGSWVTSYGEPPLVGLLQ